MIMIDDTIKILQSYKFYVILSMTVMIYTIIGCVFAFTFLLIKRRYNHIKWSPHDILTINFLIISVMFSVLNFLPYSSEIFVFAKKLNNLESCSIIQMLISILWNQQFLSIGILIIERIYYYTCPTIYYQKSTFRYFPLFIIVGWIISSCIGILISISHSVQINKLEINNDNICSCEILISNKFELGLHISTFIVPYILIIFIAIFAKYSAKKSQNSIQDKSGLERLRQNSAILDNDFYEINLSNHKLKKTHKLLISMLIILHTCKITFALLQQHNNYQTAIENSQIYQSYTNYQMSNPTFYFSTEIIGVCHLMYLISPLVDFISAIFLNKTFFKKLYTQFTYREITETLY